MKVVIVEDEELAAEKLQGLIRNAAPDCEVIQILESVEEAVNWFSANPAPDLVFMDIQLDDGTSFEIFEEISIEAPIIFTTAFDQYALRAFKVNSVDYLLKPIDKDELARALMKFKKIYNKNGDFEAKVSRVIEQLSHKYKTRFFIRVGTRFQSIPVARICAFFVEERSTFLKTLEGKTYDLDYSLDQLQTLVDPRQFYRVNRNFLININCINDIVSYSTSRLKLRLSVGFEEGIIVSRDKVSDFKHWMDK